MQTLVYMNCFIIEFLMTFIPRFTRTFYASRAEVLSSLFLFLGMAGSLRVGKGEAGEYLNKHLPDGLILWLYGFYQPAEYSWLLFSN